MYQFFIGQNVNANINYGFTVHGQIVDISDYIYVQFEHSKQCFRFDIKTREEFFTKTLLRPTN